MAQEEWRYCAEWLVKCKILAPDHRVTWTSAEVFDLASCLRDGVLLCHLLNSLQPTSVDLKDFSQRPQMSQFLCLKNIRTFLSVCKTTFQLRESDLFDPYDLFDMKDFGKVVVTLSKLSKTTLAQRSGVGSFPPAHAAQVDSSSEYYNTLELRAAELLGDQAYDSYDSDEDDHDVYEDLCSLRRIQAVQPAPALLTKREHCIRELIETEKNYVEALKMIHECFMKPLQNIITRNDYDKIFLHIEYLKEKHTKFFETMQEATSVKGKVVGTRSKDIGICFREFQRPFLVYGEFCANLPDAQAIVDTLLQGPLTKPAIENCQQKANEGRFRLRDLLSVPMQRVLKYHLLLKELLKQTEAGHKEREELEKALEAMQDLSLYVNEVKRDHETKVLIGEIQDNITDLKMPEDTTLHDYGRLLKDGELKVKYHEDNRQHNRMIFLFDKVLLMGKSRGEGYSYKDAIVLSQYRVDEANNLKKGDKAFPHQFVLAEKNNSNAFTFMAKTPEVRQKWIEAIQLALENTAPPYAKADGHDFAMHTFAEPTYCTVCEKLLRGIFFQGYLCKKTKKSVHKECISKAGQVQKSNGPAVPFRPPRASIGKCRVTFLYNGAPNIPPDNKPALQFTKGETIELLSRTSEHWWEGRKGTREGWFPAKHVQEVKSAYEEHVIQPRTTRRPSLDLHVEVQPPPLSPRRNSSASLNIGTGYVNANLFCADFTARSWYVGEMSRDTATCRLEQHTSGCYLIRASTNLHRKGEYALSVKFGTGVKHIKVNKSPDGLYYLADVKMFKTIPELVEYYQGNTLSFSFPELDTTLLTPYKDAIQNNAGAQGGPACLGFCVANFDYAASLPNQLSLQKGDRVAIVSKAGGARGWWKGKLNERVGYFPSAYVNEEEI